MSAPAAAWALGLDLGGTKIEARLLDADGAERWRTRVDTPRGDDGAARYAAIVEALAARVDGARDFAHAAGVGAPSVGVGIPGCEDADGRVKNANTTCLIGRRLRDDLGARLGMPVAVANDANCLALSEATDGAGAGAAVVFAVIVGTGVGGGLAVHGRVVAGAQGLAGEWGHNPLPWASVDEAAAAPACYCGRRGCIETWLSGPALSADHARVTGLAATAREIAHEARHAQACAAAAATLERWHDRLARALATVVNVVDPDVVVLGGGLSAIDGTPEALAARLPHWVFDARGAAGGARTPLRTRIAVARHGDASGVRGAAWLGRGHAAAPR